MKYCLVKSREHERKMRFSLLHSIESTYMIYVSQWQSITLQCLLLLHWSCSHYTKKGCVHIIPHFNKGSALRMVLHCTIG